MSKCPSSIWCQDSNPRPSEREPPPITTRPGNTKCYFKRFFPPFVVGLNGAQQGKKIYEKGRFSASG